MILDQSLMNLSEDTKNANAVKFAVLEKLRDDEVITKDEFDLYTDHWEIILVQKSWFKKLIDVDKSAWFYKYVNISFKD